MVAVGDQGTPAGQVSDDDGLLLGIAQPPEPVGHAVLGDDRQQRSALGGHLIEDAGGGLR